MVASPGTKPRHLRVQTGKERLIGTMRLMRRGPVEGFPPDRALLESAGKGA